MTPLSLSGAALVAEVLRRSRCDAAPAPPLAFAALTPEQRADIRLRILDALAGRARRWEYVTRDIAAELRWTVGQAAIGWVGVAMVDAGEIEQVRGEWRTVAPSGARRT